MTTRQAASVLELASALRTCVRDIAGLIRHPLPTLDRARNVFLAETAAFEMGSLSLEDAPQLVVLYAEAEDDKFDKAAVRWLGRLLLERPPGGDEQRHRDEPGDGSPVVGLALLHAEDEAGTCPPPKSATPTQSKVWLYGIEPRHEPGGEHEGDDAHGDVDEEDPLPPGAVDEQAADHRADEDRDAGRGTPQGHGLGRARLRGRCA